MKGWISLHRSIENHWLYEEERIFSRFEAWVDLLLMVNHKDNKLMFEGELITVKRGQKITSIRKLSDKWQWSTTKVNKFLKILESDNMIKLEKDTKKTAVTIVNYDLYQNLELEKRHQKNTEVTQGNHGSNAEVTQKNTNNNVNNELIMSNKENKDDRNLIVNQVMELLASGGIEMESATPCYKISEKLADIDDMEYLNKAIEAAKNRGIYTASYVNGIINGWFREGKNSYKKLIDHEKREKVQKFKSGSTYGTPNDEETRNQYKDLGF